MLHTFLKVTARAWARAVCAGLCLWVERFDWGTFQRLSPWTAGAVATAGVHVVIGRR